MKKIILLALSLAALLAAAAESIPSTGFYVDLYGNVYKDGANTNQQFGDYLVNHPSDAPSLDGAWRDAALRGRAKIADETKAAQDSAAAQIAAKETEKQAAITAANTARDQAIAANATALSDAQATAAAKTARVAALEAYVVQLGTYIAGLRGQIAGLGGSSQPPPAAP